MADWSNLPEELLFSIAVQLFSVVELQRFRSICRSWRSSVSGNNNLFPNRPLILINLTQWFGFVNLFLSRAAFFRVALSSSPSQGWLIKSDMDINSRKFRLIDQFSRLPMRYFLPGVNLLKFTFSEIGETYELQDRHTRDTFLSRKVVLVKVVEGEAQHNNILGLSRQGKITHWDGNNWRKLTKMDLKTDHTFFCDHFSDIIVHKGLTYALDTRGTVWWISSGLEICMYVGLPLGDNISLPEDKSFVECRGELYIVDRLRERKPYVYVPNPKTTDFKIYKFDEELGKMIEVQSLGDNAFVMATDTSFSVLAQEYYGCLQNSIYFKDAEEDQMKVFKLENGSITTMSQPPQSCFQMFVPTFL
ncbi:putative F-box protein At1g65770 [Capsella rubella]|uniref:putative F-box protein At1g65770 n=1 Tax=Capsella rubella TaxID=81985 RepID=UPI000CD4ED12|nr:putative F-box protein At1g65770 [Capsella rubella]